MKTRRVKMIKEARMPNWANEHIGEEFDVVECDSQDYYVVENGGVTNKMLSKKICETVMELSERQGILDTIKVKVKDKSDSCLSIWSNEHIGEEFSVVKYESHPEYYKEILSNSKIGHRSLFKDSCEIIL